jgi:hypothetical protein
MRRFLPLAFVTTVLRFAEWLMTMMEDYHRGCCERSGNGSSAVESTALLTRAALQIET